MKTYENRETGNVVFAEKLTWSNRDDLAKWCNGLATEEIDPLVADRKYPAINVPTPEGNKRLQEGFYLVQAGSDFYVVRPPNFDRVHKEVVG